jgi:hypothetical protein
MVRRMRRAFSIILVLFFLLSPLASALDAGQDASLPACCRRHGAHHCAMEMQTASTKPQAQSDSTPAVSTPLTCPNYPNPSTMMIGPAPALASAAAALPAVLEETFAPAAWQSAVPSHPATTHAGRGPPAEV